MVVAALAEEAMGDGVARIQAIEHRVGVLVQTRREHYYLVQITHPAQEVVDAGAFEHVEVVPVVLNLDRDDVVGGRNRLKCARSASLMTHCRDRRRLTLRLL